MIIPLCCVFSSSFTQADVNVYYIENLELQCLALQQWDAGAPGAPELQWPWGDKPAWKGSRKSNGIPTQLSTSTDPGKWKDLPKSWSSWGFPGARTDICAAGVSSSHQEQHGAQTILVFSSSERWRSLSPQYPNVLYFLGLRSLAGEEEWGWCSQAAASALGGEVEGTRRMNDLNKATKSSSGWAQRWWQVL